MAKILVVDDESAIREFLTEFLEEKGYSVISASTGQEAIAAVREQRPSLVLLDILMPQMTGLETLDRIREIDPMVGVVMLTAAGDEALAKQAMSRAAYDYVMKPIDFGYLELAIATKLAR